MKVNMMQLSNKKLAFSGLMVACGLVMGYLEFLIPLPIGIPGVKIGLSNIITLLTLYLMGPSISIIILLLRIILSGLLFGNAFGILYSLFGAVFAFASMYFCHKISKLSIVGVSVAGGVMHNIGQLILACFIVNQIKLSFYLPVLLLSGLLCGILVGIISGIVINRFDKDMGMTV